MRSIKALVIAISVMAFLCVGSPVFAKSITADVDVMAEIVDLIGSMTVTQAIDFGQLSSSNATSTYAVVNATAGPVTAITFFDTSTGPTDTSIPLSAVNAGVTAISSGASGILTITANTAGSITSITYPDVTLSLVGGGAFDTITLSEMATWSEAPSSLNQGITDFALGGALEISSTTPSGSYEGSGTITVVY